MIEFLFLDLDDTILDFHKAERLAIAKTFRGFGINPTEEVLHRYHQINRAHWHMLELGQLTRAQVLVRRFEALFEELGIACDGEAVARAYEHNLSIGHYFLPGAEEAVDALSKKYRLFLASNGTASVQKGRMTSANLYRFFEKVFVSQELGYNKPAPEFFAAAAAQIPGYDPAKAIMVGDSLTSDIQGGRNAGIRTCWVNPSHAPADPAIPADYEIESITQLEALLEEL
jgi:2-haloacid dehalogenase